MQENRHTSPPIDPQESFRAKWKRTSIAVLFSAILVIPRLRRLRRRVWAWAVVRALAIALGIAFVWRFARPSGGTVSLLAGIFLILVGALTKARPQTKSVDDTTRELGALVALNGGTFDAGSGTKRVRDVTIFVKAEKLIVLTPARQQVAELQIGELRQVQVRKAPDALKRKKEGCDLVITLGTAVPRTVHFRYEGTFAEHLARVAQDTIVSVWQKGLPVLPGT